LNGNSLDIRSSITAFFLGELSKQRVGVVEEGLKSSKMQYGPTCKRIQSALSLPFIALSFDPRACSSTLLRCVLARADLRLFWS
jgi:hypothetical protein